MAQPPDLVKLVMVFDLVNDDTSVAEVAEFAIWGKFTTTPTGTALWNSNLQELAELAVAKWAADIDPTFYSHGAKLKQARAIAADAAGHTTFEQVASPGTAWQGNAAAHSLPWANSMVISLYTYTPGSFIAHAGRRRGRIYLPPPNVSLISATNQGTVSPTDALTLLNDFKGWLDDVAGVTLTPDENVWTAGVLSRVGNEWNHLTDLAVDTKIDTQRRRERSQQAVRQSVGV